MPSDNLKKSRTQLKKEALARQKIGERLLALSDAQLHRLALPSQLTMAIRDIRNMKARGARRRQMQYIGSLMRHIDVTPIQQVLLEIEQGAYRQARDFQRIESWRDRLMAGEVEVIEEILEQYPQADRQRLGQLIRSARRERQKDAPPKSARNLFRYLKSLSSGAQRP